MDRDRKERENRGLSSTLSGNANPRDLAYNNWGNDRKTVGEVLRDGADVTDEIFSTPWASL